MTASPGGDVLPDQAADVVVLASSVNGQTMPTPPALLELPLEATGLGSAAVEQ